MCLAVLWMAATDVVGPRCPDAHAQQSASSSDKSWTESVTSPFKQGFDKLGRALNPQPATPGHAIAEDDAISLKHKSKAGPELYVAIARLYEQSGKTAEAEQQYQAALKEFPNNLPALLGYARLKDSLGKSTEAIQLYQRAAKAYPQQASVHNNLGLCYAQQNRLDEAAAAMSRAIQLEPKNPLYRNNIATVLVDRGNPREAFVHLREVHGDAAAHYNTGYLLTKKGQTQAAIQQFTLALRTDPSMVAAQRWVDYLQRSTAEARLPPPMTAAVKIISPPPAMPPDAAALQRLPPTTLRDSASNGSTLPGISFDPSATPTAPMPPGPADTALRPLPRVN
jgi:tetratricopeptide (TPR) repeat protein